MRFLLPTISLLSTLSLTTAIQIKKFDSGSFYIADSVANSDAYEPFMAAPVVLAPESDSSSKVRVRKIHHPREEDNLEKRITPEYLYTLMCTDAGFRGDCEAFGAKAGHCVSFFDYDTVLNLSSTYNDAVSSLSTNTGGTCQWYNQVGCDADGTDPGISLAYAYNLSSTVDSDYSGVGPFNGDVDNVITSWRC